MKTGPSISQHSKSVKVGIIDLIARQPDNTLYARIMNPNNASIMPQVIAAWAEQMGHQVSYVAYTGLEDLERGFAREIDILFVSAFTQSAYLAYSISNFFRKRNVVTVLGGPHARAYARDAQEYFDYVVGFTDQGLIRDLLKDCSPNPLGGVVLSAKRQPQALPGVRERWKYIRQTLGKSLLVRVVPMIGSLGCPYKCNFCVDAQVDYQPLPYDQIREDLIFLQQQPRPPIVIWHDPNFGIRFDDYMDILDSVVRPGRLEFFAESSLSLLDESHLKRLKKNHFIGIAPGIESWFGYNDKAKQGKRTGMEKVKAVAQHINLVAQYIPCVQANFLFGLDSDAGALPFELTKRFIELAPGAYPNYAMITAFGNSAPLYREYQVKGRVIDVPFPFLDGNSTLNVRLKNYSILEFYDYMVDLVRYTSSSRSLWNRFQANEQPLIRWGNLFRSIVASEKGSPIANCIRMRNLLATNREFQAFYCGDSNRPPSFFGNKIKAGLGPLYDHLPEKVTRYLELGEPAPNSRISGASCVISSAAGDGSEDNERCLRNDPKNLPAG